MGKENTTVYKHFGVMLDCSRNAVMKVSQLKVFIDCLQKMGYNTLELYTEDTYEIEGEPYFGYLRGRYTGAELKEIDAYAKSRGVELIPCVQALAHYTALVRHECYREIVDVNDILLIDHPKTYELLDKIFATLAENFTSRLVNIGMDEAFMVGLGKYLSEHGYQNRFEILLRHLQKVVEIAEKYGFKPHMWSDMFFRLASKGEYYDPKAHIPEEVKKLVPENLALTYWDYYHDEKAFYDSMISAHKEFNREIWFAGGAWSWDGFAPFSNFTFRTMKPAMESVRESGIENVLITMWGDNGAECSAFSLLHALYTIRQYADGNFEQEKIEKGFYNLFKIRYADFMLLDLPNRLSYEDEGREVFGICKSTLYTDPFMGFLDKNVASHRAIPYEQYASDLKKAGKRAGQFAYLFESLSCLCNVLAIKMDLGVRTRRAYQLQSKKEILSLAKEYGELISRLEKFHETFYALWERENKPHGWEIQDARLGGLMRRLETCKKRLKAYASGKIDKIEELEEEILPYGDGKFLGFNCYEKAVSMSLM